MRKTTRERLGGSGEVSNRKVERESQRVSERETERGNEIVSKLTTRERERETRNERDGGEGRERERERERAGGNQVRQREGGEWFCDNRQTLSLTLASASDSAL